MAPDDHVIGRTWVLRAARGAPDQQVLAAVGPLHAVRPGRGIAACGEPDVLPTGGAWPPSGAATAEPECIRCRRAVPTGQPGEPRTRSRRPPG